MANINKITVGDVSYNITIPAGLTEEEQAQVRQNIGAVSAQDVEVVRDGTYPDMTVGEATHAQNADAAVNATNSVNAQNATQATKLSNARAIDGVSFDGTAGIAHYGVCATAAGTTAKTVSLAGFTLVTGARITVKFTTANTVSSPTLNVNGTGAIAIKCKDRTTGLVWRAEIMTLVYDGTNWCIVDGYSLADKPIGTIHINEDSTSPVILFGGNWEMIPEGYALWTASSGAGNTINAGLPNITGGFRFGVSGRSFLNAEDVSGAFSGVNPQTASVSTGTPTSSNNSAVTFNANNGATVKGIYGNSATVQPPAYKTYAWKRII